MYDVFISYKKLTGEGYAKHLKETLEEVGYNCFMADLSILKGASWESEIESALKECKYFIIIITELALESEWVIKEYKKAIKLNKRIIPCRWSEIEVSETKELSKLQQIEFENKSELANEVVHELKEIEKKEKKKIPIEKDAREFLNRGNLFYNLNEFEEAEKEYREAIRINPNYADAHNNLGNLFCHLKQYREAEKEYKEAIKINPNYAESHYHLGNLLFYRFHCYREAEKEYKEAIKINPYIAEAHNNLGNLFCHLKQYREAEKEYKEAIKINPNYAESHYHLGNLLFYRFHCYREAEKEYKEAIKINPNHAKAHRHLRILYKKLM